ncbi:MAG TPA: hydroxyacylglutathione hydrolase [Caulobacteraceae bacterium]|jgi:hydroxyacylglutathione hydrolase
MALDIHQFPCLQDNYGYLVRDRATGAAACIDTPDGEEVLRQAERLGWRLGMILNTHWHPDHAGGNARVKAATGAEVVGPQEVTRLGPVDRVVGEGDVVDLGDTRFDVLETGGHTLGHISYHDAADRVAFVGDTLFALGCGRLFEGTAEQMFASLAKLKAMPPETQIYCAHEYTAANARFALSLSEDERLQARATDIFAARERGEPTVPTSIGLELATNPFLRAASAAEFLSLRQAKDAFRG